MVSILTVIIARGLLSRSSIASGMLALTDAPEKPDASVADRQGLGIGEEKTDHPK